MSTRNWSRTGSARRGRVVGHATRLWIVGLLGGLYGCGGGASSQEVASDRSPLPASPDTLAAHLFNFAQDTVLAPLVADWPQLESKNVRSHTQEAESEREAVAMVYRVQLYTTKDLGTAQAVGKEAETDFGEKVQIDYEVPYYKVRVGVFASPQAAEPVLQEARRLGYKGAWAVRLRASLQAP